MTEHEHHAARPARRKGRRMSAMTWARRLLITGVLVAWVWQFARMVEQLIVQCGLAFAVVVVLIVMGSLALAVAHLTTVLDAARRDAGRRAGRGGDWS